MEHTNKDFEKMHDNDENNDTSEQLNKGLRALLNELFGGNIDIKGTPLFVFAACFATSIIGVGTLSVLQSIVTAIAGAYIESYGIDVDYFQAILRTTILYSALSFSYLGVFSMILAVLKFAHKQDMYSREYSTRICWIIMLLPAHIITGVNLSTLFVSYCLHVGITFVATKLSHSESWIIKVLPYTAFYMLEAVVIYIVAMQQFGDIKDTHNIGVPVSLIFGAFSINWIVPALPYIFPNAFQII